jgi:hypothetical protein
MLSGRWYQNEHKSPIDSRDEAKIQQTLESGYMVFVKSDGYAIQAWYHPEKQHQFPYSIRQNGRDCGVLFCSSRHELFYHMRRFAPLHKWRPPFTLVER